ncbi:MULTISPECIES: ArsI/CadI family heavy metal resistance metalloenzyme [Methylomonas]|uniref:Glyoxalase n=2 Tax=Methylomonas TaxID=416 RepID=A0A140E5A8_9GAMM|nr:MULTISPECIES: ArsI/CadI family heavy metal resistance metalloenzyme [Methylomonas]AMK75582.1 glyoxalase [Methylomonas denitrificans]OAI09198.1 glyoxalase [Methylomonas methanica]TCV79079.1 catechol 2,3-dioxygenase-like lactoylglutathione lyase family enzyme [Methylomonas methanica]
MKRLHIHLAVDDLAKNIDFYSALFQSAPSVREADYAKWLLDDPRVNFAVSSRGRQPGLDHLGIQVESSEELEAVEQNLAAAELPVAAQKQANCCYAQSDKYWTVDPQGIAWETFHSLQTIPLFGDDQVVQLEPAGSCCKPSTTDSAAQ